MYSGAVKYSLSTKLYITDTIQENKIGLMKKYTYKPMNEGECWISEDIAERLNLQLGDLMY